MTVSAHQLQAMYARRREAEHLRNERSAAVHRYYDHWGQVTSRFQNWTNPEYYEQADAQLRKSKQQKEKALVLTERRNKLKKLLDEEQDVYDAEVKNLQRCKPRSRKQVDIETLEKIAEQAKEREHIKRKLELEAKLYGRWRHGVDDENMIFDSKSEHQVLAKLNWLDKKVDEQMEREKQEAVAQERQLKMQEEQRKLEETQMERQQLRAQEIKDVQQLQQQHMDALKQHHTESSGLRDEEKKLRSHVHELAKERELLEESSAYVREPPEIAQAFNLKKIKVMMRNRADTFRNQLKLIVNVLERLQPYAIQTEQVERMLNDYRKEMQSEELITKQIDCMYESEAKYNLQRCEEAWQAQHLKHYNDMKRLLDDEYFMYNTRLKDNVERQKEIIDLRETHIAAIEQSNSQLQQLMEEQDLANKEDSAAVAAKSAGAGDMSVECLHKTDKNDNSNKSDTSSYKSFSSATKPGYFGQTESAASIYTKSDNVSLNKVQSSFHNLNLDVWKDMASARSKGNESPRVQSQRLFRTVTPETAERPKFARKRIAWT